MRMPASRQLLAMPHARPQALPTVPATTLASQPSPSRRDQH